MMQYIGISDFMMKVTILLVLAFVILLVLTITVAMLIRRIHMLENKLNSTRRVMDNRIWSLESRINLRKMLVNDKDFGGQTHEDVMD